MGLSLGSLKQKIFGGIKYKILMVGLDAAGKTTILYKLKIDEAAGNQKIQEQFVLGEAIKVSYQLRYNVETVEYKNFIFQSWDVGGSDKIWPPWKNHIDIMDGLIFVVASNEKERMDDVKEELIRILQEDGLRKACILIFANKEDLPNAMGVEQLIDVLQLNQLKERKWYIQPTCAINGFGLYEGLDWLEKRLNEKQKDIKIQARILRGSKRAGVNDILEKLELVKGYQKGRPSE